MFGLPWHTLHERERAATYNQLLAVWRETLCNSIGGWAPVCKTCFPSFGCCNLGSVTPVGLATLCQARCLIARFSCLHLLSIVIGLAHGRYCAIPVVLGVYICLFVHAVNADLRS